MNALVSHMGLDRRALLAGCAAAAALGACGGGGGPIPRETFYRLGEPAPLAPLSGGPILGAVDVPPLRNSGVAGERAILYRDGPRQVAQYNYHAWAEPPTVMIQRAVIAALRAANAFETVATPEMRLDRQYELMGDLRLLEHVLGGTGATAVVEVELGLRRVRSNAQLLLKTYRGEEAAADAGVPAGIAAFTRAVDKICAALVTDLAALPKQPASA